MSYWMTSRVIGWNRGYWIEQVILITIKLIENLLVNFIFIILVPAPIHFKG